MQNRSVIILILCLACIAVFYNGLSGRFIWDDQQLIVDNPLIRSFSHVADIFRSELHFGTLTNYYRPLQTLSFMADYFLFGLRPFGYHLTNLLLHLLAGILLFLFLGQLTKNNFLSLAASLLFLVHPIQTETVDYISGRADSLVAIFIFASLIGYLRFLKSLDQKGYRWSLLFFILALLSKENAVMLPVVVLGLDLFARQKDPKRILRLAPFFIILLVYVFLRMSILNFSSGDIFLSKKGFALWEIGLGSRVVIFCKTLVIYLGSLLIPVDLHMERITIYEKISSWHVLGFLIWCAIGGLAWVRLRLKRDEDRSIFLFSLFWFLAWLLPQSALILPKTMADHFLYLPSTGIFLVIGLMLDGWGDSRKKKVILILFALYLALFTWFYNHEWQDELSFFNWTARLSPHSFKVHDSLASLYLENHRIEAAIAEYRMILSPDAKRVQEKDFARFAQEVLRRPMDEKKRKIVAITFYNLGVVYGQKGDDETALIAYGYALTTDPRSKLAYNNLGLLYEKKGLFAKAEAAYQEAIALDPGFVPAYNNLAQAYAEKGDYDKAISLWEKVLSIKPDYELAKKNIALARELKKAHP